MQILPAQSVVPKSKRRRITRVALDADDSIDHIPESIQYQCGKPIFNVHEEIVQARHTHHLRKGSSHTLWKSLNITRKMA
jgi:uncharacterized protein YcgL (UPF0745 family)